MAQGKTTWQIKLVTRPTFEALEGIALVAWRQGLALDQQASTPAKCLNSMPSVNSNALGSH